MTTEYTGPLKPSEREMEQWYHRMKDALNPIQLNQFGVACHPDDEPMIRDMLERLIEDDTWPHDEVPPLVTSTLMKRNELRPVALETLKQVHMRNVVNARTGFGRFGGLLLPRGRGEGLHDPWKDSLARSLKEERKPVRADDPSDGLVQREGLDYDD
jgi:hypothetical protein